jgi:hypothetical protein
MTCGGGRNVQTSTVMVNLLKIDAMAVYKSWAAYIQQVILQE